MLLSLIYGACVAVIQNPGTIAAAIIACNMHKLVPNSHR